MVMHVCSMAHLFVARTTIFGIEFIMKVAGWEKKKTHIIWLAIGFQSRLCQEAKLEKLPSTI